MENLAPRVLHYSVFAPRRMISLYHFIVLSQFFYTMLPKLMTDGAELSFLPLKLHGGTPVFSLSSDIGSYAACTEPLARVSTCCEGTLCYQIPKLCKDPTRHKTPSGDISPRGNNSLSLQVILPSNFEMGFFSSL